MTKVITTQNMHILHNLCSSLNITIFFISTNKINQFKLLVNERE